MLHQYSESGVVPGIDDTYVDLNNFNGDEKEFIQWISPAGQKPTLPQPSAERDIRREARRVARRTAKRVTRQLIKRRPDV